MEKIENNPQSQPGGLVLDTRSRAQLRRNDPWEVRGAYLWVARIKQSAGLNSVDDARLMRLAPLVGEVREDDSRSIGAALSAAKISELRVRRLLASSPGQDIEDQLARVVRLLKRKVNVADLVKTAIFWGDSKRRELARQYFGSSDE